MARRAIYLSFTLGLALLIGVLFSPPAAFAHEGHDHGQPASTAPGAPSSPRVVAVSDSYQLVGIVEGEVLVVYLDRAADNAPVKAAELEISIAGQTLKAEPTKDGTYEFTLPLLRQPGTHDVVFSLTEGATSDLLVGALVVPGPSANATAAAGWWSGTLAAATKWLQPAAAQSGRDAARKSVLPSLAIIAGLALLIGLLVGRRLARRGRASAVALFGLVYVLTVSPAAQAHEGHDHGPDVSASTGNAPSRRPDGTIFLPKPTQRLLEVRTWVVAPRDAAKAVRLTGRIIANPNFSGVVQSTIQGRYQAPASGVPPLGMPVKAGEVLGRVTPSFTSMDMSDRAQTRGDLEQQISLARAKLVRQETLLRTNVVARAAVDETRLQLDGLLKRQAELTETGKRTEDLVAPVDGVIAAVKVVSGQVVSQTDQIFQIVDPSRLLVEALVFDQINPDEVKEATAQIDERTSVPLRFVGRSRALQQQYTIMQFEIAPASVPLNVGAAVLVIARNGAPVSGIFVKRSALAQAPNGQTVVFVHKEPEVFAPRAVRVEPFDSDTVLVVGGLAPGDKIVVQGAPLVNQVR